MPDRDVDFSALREVLEADARPPTFEVIRSRRRRRNRAVVTIGAATAITVVISVGTALAIGGVRRDPPPPVAPQPSATVSTPGQIIGQRDVTGMATSPSGALYIVATTCEGTPPTTPPAEGSLESCDRSQRRNTLLVSRDLAATWSQIADTPAGGELVVVNESQLWIDEKTTWDPVRIRWKVAASADGGRTWQSWDLEQTGLAASNINSVHLIDSAGGTTWISHGPDVWVATGVAQPVKTVSKPPGFNNIFQLTAIGPDHAVVMGSPNNTVPAEWYETTDRGVHWNRIGDPCDGIPHPASLFSDLAVAPDGSWWVTCVASRDRGEVVVSVDGGGTWQRRGAITDPIGAGGPGPGSTGLHPLSATTAWRTGVQGHITRTIDGTTWIPLPRLGGTDVFQARFVALDGNTAMYLPLAEPAGRGFIVTRDGGTTRTLYPLPTVS
jgi:hypothetical protein